MQSKLEQRFLSPPQVARMLRCGADQVLAFIRSGELKATNLSTGSRPRWKISPVDLQSFLDGRSNQATRQEPSKKKRPLPVPSREWV
jgi:hypothetical protein